MPQYYSLEGKYVSKGEYEKFRGITKPESKKEDNLFQKKEVKKRKRRV